MQRTTASNPPTTPRFTDRPPFRLPHDQSKLLLSRDPQELADRLERRRAVRVAKRARDRTMWKEAGHQVTHGPAGREEARLDDGGLRRAVSSERLLLGPNRASRLGVRTGRPLPGVNAAGLPLRRTVRSISYGWINPSHPSREAQSWTALKARGTRFRYGQIRVMASRRRVPRLAPPAVPESIVRLRRARLEERRDQIKLFPGQGFVRIERPVARPCHL